MMYRGKMIINYVIVQILLDPIEHEDYHFLQDGSAWKALSKMFLGQGHISQPYGQRGRDPPAMSCTHSKCGICAINGHVSRTCELQCHGQCPAIYSLSWTGWAPSQGDTEQLRRLRRAQVTSKALFGLSVYQSVEDGRMATYLFTNWSADAFMQMFGAFDWRRAKPIVSNRGLQLRASQR